MTLKNDSTTLMDDMLERIEALEDENYRLKRRIDEVSSFAHALEEAGADKFNEIERAASSCGADDVAEALERTDDALAVIEKRVMALEEADD